LITEQSMRNLQNDVTKAEDSLPPQTPQRDVFERLDRIEASLALLVQQRTIKDWYSTHEIAELTEREEFTVREWCRNGRINAKKKGSGRGKYQSWVISHDELQRFRKEGLLPPRRP